MKTLIDLHQLEGRTGAIVELLRFTIVVFLFSLRQPTLCHPTVDSPMVIYAFVSREQ